MPGISGIVGDRLLTSPETRFRQLAGPLRTFSWYATNRFADAERGTMLVRVGREADLSGGLAQSGPRTAVMDGELYDTDVVAQRLGLSERRSLSDVEILLLGFERFGAEFLKELHGFFVAAIWDQDARKLWLLNDRFGLRTLYLGLNHEQLVFSSSVRPIISTGTVNGTVSLTGLGQFFTFGHYLRDQTSVEGVTVLPPASVACYSPDNGRLRCERYWDINAPHSPLQLSESEWIERLDHAFTEAVRRRCQGNVELGLSLSGGMDARTILGVADPQRPLRTVCVGMPGSRDHAAAARLARIAGVPHHNFTLDTAFLADYEKHLRRMVRITDGQYLSQCIVMPTLEFHRELGITCLLRGHAGELMHMNKAYNYSLDSQMLGDTVSLPQWLERRLSAYMLQGVEFPLFHAPFEEAMRESARQAIAADLDDLDGVEPGIQRIWRLFVTQRLRRETALSMVKFRTVVETRLPYLDNQVVDLLLQAPAHLKMYDAIQTSILAKHRPEFLDVVNVNTGTTLRAGKWRRSIAGYKMRVLAKLGVPGYQPYERLGLWLRRELRPLVQSLLLSESFLERGIFHPLGVKHVVENHLANRRNHTFLLMAMMIFELGQRHLLNETPADSAALETPSYAS